MNDDNLPSDSPHSPTNSTGATLTFNVTNGEEYVYQQLHESKSLRKESNFCINNPINNNSLARPITLPALHYKHVDIESDFSDDDRVVNNNKHPPTNIHHTLFKIPPERQLCCYTATFHKVVTQHGILSAFSGCSWFLELRYFPGVLKKLALGQTYDILFYHEYPRLSVPKIILEIRFHSAHKRQELAPRLAISENDIIICYPSGTYFLETFCPSSSEAFGVIGQ